jgi:hypothetical protein
MVSCAECMVPILITIAGNPTSVQTYVVKYVNIYSAWSLCPLYPESILIFYYYYRVELISQSGSHWSHDVPTSSRMVGSLNKWSTWLYWAIMHLSLKHNFTLYFALLIPGSRSKTPIPVAPSFSCVQRANIVTKHLLRKLVQAIYWAPPYYFNKDVMLLSNEQWSLIL